MLCREGSRAAESVASAPNVAGFAKGTGPVKFDLNRRHSSMANVAWGPNGQVHSYKEYKQRFGRP